MKNSIVPLETWPNLLPLFIAEYESSIGTPLYTLDEIAEHFDISVEKIELYKQQTSFRAEVRSAIVEIKDSNSTVRRKASAQFENYLDTIVPKWMVDDDFPASEKVKVLQFLAKTGRIVDDPIEKAKAESANKTPVVQAPTLVINFPPANQMLSGITITQDGEKVINGQ